MQQRRDVDAHVLVSGLGALHRPAWPAFEGLERFAGTRFHSAAWDHSVSLTGKRVAIIGTGASAFESCQRLRWRLRSSRSSNARRRGSSQARPSAPLLGASLAVHPHPAHPALDAPGSPRPRLRCQSALGPHRGPPGQPHAGAAGARTRRCAPGCCRTTRLDASGCSFPTTTCRRCRVPTLSWSPIRSPKCGSAASSRPTAGARNRRHDLHHSFRVTEPWSPLRIFGRSGLELNEAWRNGLKAYLGITLSGFPNLYLLMGPRHRSRPQLPSSS